jgi:hypothetical protein
MTNTTTKREHEWCGRDFSARVRRSLAAKGVYIVGMTSTADAAGHYLTGRKFYQLDANGTARDCTYQEVEALAA